jgi:hypothetical protein
MLYDCNTTMRKRTVTNEATISKVASSVQHVSGKRMWIDPARMSISSIFSDLRTLYVRVHVTTHAGLHILFTPTLIDPRHHLSGR